MFEQVLQAGAVKFAEGGGLENISGWGVEPLAAARSHAQPHTATSATNSRTFAPIATAHHDDNGDNGNNMAR